VGFSNPPLCLSRLLHQRSSSMAHLYKPAGPPCTYWDRQAGSRELWLEKLRTSRTVYVGNLSFYTTEDQVYELFRKVGPVEQIVMGLNRMKKVPCGFCFVKYLTVAGADAAVEILNETVCDQRVIRVDKDTGDDVEGTRKYGRGSHGLQWRDEFRKEYDVGRGGEGGGLQYTPGRRKRREDDHQHHSMYARNNFPGDILSGGRTDRQLLYKKRLAAYSYEALGLLLLPPPSTTAPLAPISCCQSLTSSIYALYA